jgi:hypothetical protein
MGQRQVLRTASLLLVVGLTAGGCSTRSANDSETSPATEAPVLLTDGAVIWCDENRWQVEVRASQMGVAFPPSNPAEPVVAANAHEQMADIDTDIDLGVIALE